MVATVRLATGRARQAALVTVHTSSAFVLTGDSPVAGTTHTRSSLPQARVTVGAMLEAGLVTVAPPQALRTRLATTRAPPAWQTVALPGGSLAAVGMNTITPLQAAWPKRAHRARLVTARPLPAGCAGAGSICRITFCPVGAVAGGVASWTPGSLRAGGGTVQPLPALFTEALPVNGRAVDKVFTGALQGAVLSIGATFTWTLTVNPREPRGALALTGGAVTHSSIHTETRLQAAMTVETVSAGLVTEQSRPPRLARAFSFHWVTAECVFLLAETGAFTVHAIFARCAHPVPAVGTTEARLAQAASINVVAACTISTVAHTFAVLTISACSTLLIAPVTSETFSTLALSSFWVTFASVVADALLSTVWSKPSLWTSFCANCTRPSRGASADPFAPADATILAGASCLAFPGTRLLTESPSESVPTHTLSGCFIAGSSGPTLAPLQAALPEGACWTGVLAVASYEAWRTLTCAPDWIAESSVLTLALLTAAWPPVFVITGAGTVVASPASLTLAAVRSDTSTVDALLGAARDTFVSALVISWTALVPLAVVGLHRLPVGRLVGDPVARASVGGPRVRAGLLCHMVVRMRVGLFH